MRSGSCSAGQRGLVQLRCLRAIAHTRSISSSRTTQVACIHPPLCRSTQSGTRTSAGVGCLPQRICSDRASPLQYTSRLVSALVLTPLPCGCVVQEDVADMKRKEAQNEKLMTEIAQENKRLSEPLQRALKEVELQRHQLANYDKDKTSLSQTKMRLTQTDKRLRNLQWCVTGFSPRGEGTVEWSRELRDWLRGESTSSPQASTDQRLRHVCVCRDHEVMEQRFGQVQKERDELYGKFEASIYDVQQKSGLKNLLLERKLSTLGEQLEKKEAQLGEVLAASNLDPGTLSQVRVLKSLKLVFKDPIATLLHTPPRCTGRTSTLSPPPSTRLPAAHALARPAPKP